MIRIYPTARRWRSQVRLGHQLHLAWVETPGVGIGSADDGINGHWETEDRSAADRMAAKGAKVVVT